MEAKITTGYEFSNKLKKAFIVTAWLPAVKSCQKSARHLDTWESCRFSSKKKKATKPQQLSLKMAICRSSSDISDRHFLYWILNRTSLLLTFSLLTAALLFDNGQAGNIYFSFPLRAAKELQFPKKMGHISRRIIWDINPERRREPTDSQLWFAAPKSPTTLTRWQIYRLRSVNMLDRKVIEIPTEWRWIKSTVQASCSCRFSKKT